MAKGKPASGKKKPTSVGGVNFPAAGQLMTVASVFSSTKSASPAVVKKSNVKGQSDNGKSKKSGIVMKKELGQHILKNPGVITKILDASQIKPSDTVLEIGPGTGNLTVGLCRVAKRVIAMDVDKRMIAEVKSRCLQMGYNNVTILHGDAIKSPLGEFDVCAANLPYQISSPFLFRLLSHRPLFRCAVLMFQKEFVDRLVAQPGESQYCRLSVNVQLFSTVSRVCNVSAGSFNPPPKVESAIVKIVPKKTPIDVPFTEWDGMLRMIFSRKNRTLRSSLLSKRAANFLLRVNSVLHGNMSLAEVNDPSFTPSKDDVTKFKDLIEKVLDESGYSSSRGTHMSMDDFLALLLAFHKHGIHFASVKHVTQSSLSISDQINIMLNGQTDDEEMSDEQEEE